MVTKDGHGRWTYIVSNDMQADVTTIVQRKRSRWNIETLFRDGKQFAGFGACQCRVPQAMVRHVAFVLLAYVVLSQLKLDPSETVGEVKERLQLHVVTHGAPPPPPLKGPDKNYAMCNSLTFWYTSKKATQKYTAVNYSPGDFFVFGKETLGLPEDLLAAEAKQAILIPIFSPAVRSLNLANSAAIILYEAIRQTSPLET